MNVPDEGSRIRVFVEQYVWDKKDPEIRMATATYVPAPASRAVILFHTGSVDSASLLKVMFKTGVNWLVSTVTLSRVDFASTWMHSRPYPEESS
jgi:hypothetical protein